MPRFLAILLFILVWGSTTAQKRVRLDSSAIHPKSFSSEKMIGFKANKEFKYEKELEGPKSDWRRFWDWIMEKLNNWFDLEGVGLSYLLFGAAIAILIICILNVRGLNRTGFFSRKNKTDEAGESMGIENIHEISFDHAILNAISSEDFRLAVRLLYLQALKALTDKGIIKWQLNKTNMAYLKELSDSPFQQLFSELTTKFESSWYGYQSLRKNDFQAVADRFQLFKTEISKA
jgi:hypothetical protein